VTFLPDVNVLIALIDPTHIHHDPTHRWFDDEGRHSWATCPLTQNGALRIISHPAYPNTPGAPSIVAAILARAIQLPGHVFWPDDISVLDTDRFAPAALLSHKQITDTYLLGPAVAHGGKLATLDARLSASATRHGKDALVVIQ
jgi:toxin-antitoxin system PIN domain toxin